MSAMGKMYYGLIPLEFQPAAPKPPTVLDEDFNHGPKGSPIGNGWLDYSNNGDTSNGFFRVGESPWMLNNTGSNLTQPTNSNYLLYRPIAELNYPLTVEAVFKGGLASSYGPGRITAEIGFTVGAGSDSSDTTSPRIAADRMYYYLGKSSGGTTNCGVGRRQIIGRSTNAADTWQPADFSCEKDPWLRMKLILQANWSATVEVFDHKTGSKLFSSNVAPISNTSLMDKVDHFYILPDIYDARSSEVSNYPNDCTIRAAYVTTEGVMVNA